MFFPFLFKPLNTVISFATTFYNYASSPGKIYLNLSLFIFVKTNKTIAYYLTNKFFIRQIR